MTLEIAVGGQCVNSTARLQSDMSFELLLDGIEDVIEIWISFHSLITDLKGGIGNSLYSSKNSIYLYIIHHFNCNWNNSGDIVWLNSTVWFCRFPICSASMIDWCACDIWWKSLFILFSWADCCYCCCFQCCCGGGGRACWWFSIAASATFIWRHIANIESGIVVELVRPVRPVRLLSDNNCHRDHHFCDKLRQQQLQRTNALRMSLQWMKVSMRVTLVWCCKLVHT